MTSLAHTHVLDGQTEKGRLNSPPWHSQPAEEVLHELGSNRHGLSSKEAAWRLLDNGPNELKEAIQIQPWQLFLGQFKSLLVWILIVAGAVSGLIGEWVDAIAILAIVILNAIIGFYQEFNAEKSIAALKKMTAPHAKVRREGRVVSIDAVEIVPGDLLELEAGDLVPADARLLSASSLKCVESALTGEADAVEKSADALCEPEAPLGDRENMIFMGTSVASGVGQAVVVATGMHTEIGHIANLIENAAEGETTPLQKNLASLGRLLVWASLGIVCVLFALGLLRGWEFFEMFMTAVSLAVAAVPEGLPAVVTIALALGVMRMSRRHALVRRLPAVETLGSTNVICTDKTGTLTVGEMTVRELFVAGKIFHVTGEGYGPHGEILFEGKASDAQHAAPLLELANILIGCNNAHLVLDGSHWKVIGDPTEGALLAAGHKAGGNKEHIEQRLPKHHEIPFDSDRKRRTVIRLIPGEQLRAFVNGAPDLLLECCTHLYTAHGVRRMTDDDRHEISRRNAEMARRALRVLGSAYRDLNHASPEKLTASHVENDLVFVGLAGMYDPPRPEAKEAVAKCRAAGIRVVMITGDHPHTALAIARELGIARENDAALSGVDLDKINDDELRHRAPSIAVYARVTAKHKLRIIRAWKSNNAVVAMTGDGVNDAPAIKGADIGVAMGRTGTEVTKQAADIIITDDNFASIVSAVEEGRGIYDNIRKTLQYLLAGNCGELLLMTVCIVAGLPAPLLPIHLLWINLVTDGLPALCLATDPIDSDVMKRKPRSSSGRFVSPSFLQRMLLAGFLTGAVSVGVYLYGLETKAVDLARTEAFAVLVFAELLKSFSFRSQTKPLWRISFFSNVNLLAVVFISFSLQIWSHHSRFFEKVLKTTEMSFSHCAMLLIIAAIPLAVLELMKCIGKRGGDGSKRNSFSHVRTNEQGSGNI